MTPQTPWSSRSGMTPSTPETPYMPSAKKELGDVAQLAPSPLVGRGFESGAETTEELGRYLMVSKK